MSLIDRLSAPPRLLPAALIGVCLSALGIALLAQHGGGLPPCELCIWQRWAYGAAIAALLPGALAPPDRPTLRRLSLAFGALAFTAGAGISVFHAGVEQGWWPGLSGCAANYTATTAEEMLAQMLAAPIARCDEIPWSFLGLSIAGWNAVASALLAALAGLGAIRGPGTVTTRPPASRPVTPGPAAS